MKIKELIKVLQKKDQEKDIECIIVADDTSIEVLVLERHAVNMSKILKLLS